MRQRGEVTYWRRPGKGQGISGTTNYAGTGLLYIFSTNAAPFESDTAYTAFATYTLLEHSGNFVAAAHTLQRQGYGVRREHGLRVHTAASRPAWSRRTSVRESPSWR